MFSFSDLGLSEKWIKRQIAKAKKNEGKLTKEQRKSLREMLKFEIKKARGRKEEKGRNRQ